MFTKRIAVGLLGVIVCSLVLWLGAAEAAHVSSFSAGSPGSPAPGASGSPAPSQSPASSSPGHSQSRSASEGAVREHARVEKPQRPSLRGPGSGRRQRRRGRGRRNGQRGCGSGRAGRNARGEKRLMRYLKQQLEMTSQAPRKRRIAKKWANESRSKSGKTMNRLLTRK